MLKDYLLAILIAAVIILGFSLNGKLNKIDKLNSDIATLETSLGNAVAANGQLTKSCDISLDALRSRLAEQDSIQKAKEDALSKVKPKPNPTPREKVIEASDSAPSVFELDPDTVRLLNSAYCYSHPTEVYCTSSSTASELSKTNPAHAK